MGYGPPLFDRLGPSIDPLALPLRANTTYGKANEAIKKSHESTIIVLVVCFDSHKRC